MKTFKKFTGLPNLTENCSLIYFTFKNKEN